MMHSADVERYLARCAETFNAFVAILQGDGQDLIQAYALYYFLVDALIRRVRMVIHQVRKSCARYILIQSTIRPLKTGSCIK